MKTNLKDRFIPMKRTATDNKVWWVVYDTKEKCFSTLLIFGKYRTRKECQFVIDFQAQNIIRLYPELYTA